VVIRSNNQWAKRSWLGVSTHPPKISGFPKIISVVSELFEVTSQMMVAMVALSHPGESPRLKTFVTSGWSKLWF
jgi:hypothetical protein